MHFQVVAAEPSDPALSFLLSQFIATMDGVPLIPRNALPPPSLEFSEAERLATTSLVSIIPNHAAFAAMQSDLSTKVEEAYKNAVVFAADFEQRT